MPSQEEYLDNLSKGIENEETTESVEEKKKPEPAEQDAPQIDMSDMDDLLQSALNAQKEDAMGEAVSDTASENKAIHSEETASMSEDEIDRLLQQNREQAEEAPKQENTDSNDDLIRMLESADEEGLSNLLDQVSPQPAGDTADEVTTEEQKKGKRGRRKKKEKKLGFFDRFKKKTKEEPVETTETTEPVDSWDPLTSTDPVAENPVSENPVSENPVSEAADTETTGTSDDELDALLAGAFPGQQDSAEESNAEPESSDIMDILKAAGADIAEDAEQKKEKKGFFAKLLDLFTEEDEEEEENDQLKLSDENKQILEEMDKNGKNGKKKEKKQKKEKKPKKEKQPKKPKKEKPKKEAAPAAPEKKLSPKKIIPIVVVCISLGAVILIVGNFLTEYMSKRSGREAYYAGDYQTCYQNLFGRELNETEQVMYSKSESILTIRMWLREYEVFVNEGSELEALDSLLQAVHDYPSLLDYATQWNVQDEVTSAFGEILNILSEKYQLSQEEAQAIADISDNVEYTKNVMLVLQKLGLGSWEFPDTTQTVTAVNPAQNTENLPEELPDPLPEEKEIQQ